ncbi:MAG: DUF255 domain-containing protein [Gammaproteobacteria bacterium]|nr:DUF255 domain-containing protein [Gammaproteobacteria bacterium]
MKLPPLLIAPVLIGVTALLSGNTLAITVDEYQAMNISPRSAALTQRIEQALKVRGENYKPRTEHLHDDGSPVFTNRLILEDSPYLIQHAHNPIDWFSWGAEASEAAKRDNKPIFLSIGYSTCHWCHVMERESFESPEIAAIINQYFIPIKVDRERRPDVDKTYMQAVQLIAGNGGWPMSSFLTSAGKPFYGGTYFPPDVFKNLLLRVADLWSGQQQDLINQGEQISQAMAQINNRRLASGKLSSVTANNAANQALSIHDELQGGFGEAPKFPQEPLLFLLLAHAERNSDIEVLTAVETTLDAMSRGGIYDQVGGGFHRYSTDSEWLVPHFEKMLYNQAHLGRVFLLAWRLTGNPAYQRITTQTLDYVLRDMKSPEGAFYSATDADSEGEEGVFFTWSTEQIHETLSKTGAAFAIELFGISEAGNFEGSNILHLPVSLEKIAAEQDIALSELSKMIDRIRETLYQARENREHPLRDEKILTAWNGMMISTLAQAGMLLNRPDYTAAAVHAAQFILDNNHPAVGELLRVYLDGSSSISAHQEDYAYFAEGLLHIYDATGEAHWLAKAEEIANAMFQLFWDEKTGSFHMSRDEQQLTALGRPKDDGTDGAIPSGSSVALRVLQMLDARVANFEYGKRANAILSTFANVISQNPTAFGYMLAGSSDLEHGELSAQRYAARGGVRATAHKTTAHNIAVDISIPRGWHINSNQPLQQGLIPTSISIDPVKTGLQLAKVSFPDPITTTLGFQKEPLSVYHGDIQIQLEVDTDNKKPVAVLPIELHIQACNDKICLPPEKVALHLPMHVR